MKILQAVVFQVLATTTISYAQFVPVYISDKQSRYTGEYTFESKSKPLTQTKSMFGPGSRLYSYTFEYVVTPQKGKDTTQIQVTVSKAATSGVLGNVPFSVSTESAFTKNQREEKELSKLMDIVNKPRTLTFANNKLMKTSKVPLSQGVRLPFVRSYLLNSFYISRVPNIDSWADTLQYDDEVYITRFKVTERAAGRVKLTVMGALLAGQAATKYFSATGQKVTSIQSLGMLRLGKDEYSGTIEVEATTGVMLIGIIKRYQEQYNNLGNSENHIGTEIIQTIRNKRL
jgi:hypothetical protein